MIAAHGLGVTLNGVKSDKKYCFFEFDLINFTSSRYFIFLITVALGILVISEIDITFNPDPELLRTFSIYLSNTKLSISDVIFLLFSLYV